MSRGTTLTLYKKYKLQMTSDAFGHIVQKYVNRNREHDYSDAKKSEEEYAKDIPLIVPVNPFQEESKYDECSGQWIDVRPEITYDYLNKSRVEYVDKTDRMYCEKIMEWDFGSGFDCLVEKYNLCCCSYANSVINITPKMAYEMLSAINYILDGNWSSSAELGMKNQFIKTFTDGYNCDSYWKYVLRNRRFAKSKVFKMKQDGYDITIKCPPDRKRSNECEYDSAMQESDECIEHNLDMFRNGLTAFLFSDNWKRPFNDDENENEWMHDRPEYKYILTYEYWG